MTETTTDDPMLDEEWLASPGARPRGRIVLVAALAGALCFLGGAMVQKHLGTDDGAATATGPAGGGFPAGGLPEGMPEGLPAMGGGAGALPEEGASAGPGDDQEAGDAESVIGEVVRVRRGSWVVEDLGGERHRIVLAEDVEITREATVSPDDVRAGDAVTVAGTVSRGQLTADEVTVR